MISEPEAHRSIDDLDTMWSTAVLILAAAWIFHCAVCLWHNIKEAKKLNVPLIIVPVSPMNTLWILFEPLLLPCFESLPLLPRTLGRYCRRGWHFQDKYRTHLEHGDVWVLVTPGQNFLYVANASAVKDILNRRDEFQRPLELYSRSK